MRLRMAGAAVVSALLRVEPAAREAQPRGRSDSQLPRTGGFWISLRIRLAVDSAGLGLL